MTTSHDDVQGHCPACRGTSLFLAAGGHVTCRRIDCPNPTAADELLHGTHDVFTLAERTPAAEAELERLSAGEEPVTDPHVEHTPGQWIWQWNRATPAKRLEVAAAVIRDAAKASHCFFMGHDKRLEEDQRAWVAVARVRDVIADMENITGARHWARILRTAVDGKSDTTPDEEPACDAYQPPTTSEDSGLCARCGMSDYKHTRRAADELGIDPVDPVDQYRRTRIELEHWQTVIVPELRKQRDQLAAALSEILLVFSPVSSHSGVRIGWTAQHPIHSDDYDRWTNALSKETPDA